MGWTTYQLQDSINRCSAPFHPIYRGRQLRRIPSSPCVLEIIKSSHVRMAQKMLFFSFENKFFLQKKSNQWMKSKQEINESDRSINQIKWFIFSCFDHEEKHFCGYQWYNICIKEPIKTNPSKSGYQSLPWKSLQAYPRKHFDRRLLQLIRFLVHRISSNPILNPMYINPFIQQSYIQSLCTKKTHVLFIGAIYTDCM